MEEKLDLSKIFEGQMESPETLRGDELAWAQKRAASLPAHSADRCRIKGGLVCGSLVRCSSIHEEHPSTVIFAQKEIYEAAELTGHLNDLHGSLLRFVPQAPGGVTSTLTCWRRPACTPPLLLCWMEGQVKSCATSLRTAE